MTDIADVARGYELADRYRRDDGRVFLSGSQALARLPYEQLRHDRRAGLDTAAFVSGYPGSPLAGYDRDVAGVAKLAEADGLRIVVRPAVNEELAATAVAFYLIMTLRYEWTHFLVHTRYRPRSAYYRRLWRNHRLHHCKNENYWYGVTMLGGDRLLRTAPAVDSVTTSATCRSLGIEVGPDFGMSTGKIPG